MDPYEETYDPSNPPNSLRRLRVHSSALPWFLAALGGVIALVGVVLLFWTVSHPRSTLGADKNEEIVGTSGYYSTEGGDPLAYRRPASTQDELKFRGTLTPPSEVRGR